MKVWMLVVVVVMVLARVASGDTQHLQAFVYNPPANGAPPPDIQEVFEARGTSRIHHHLSAGIMAFPPTHTTLTRDSNHRSFNTDYDATELTLHHTSPGFIELLKLNDSSKLKQDNSTVDRTATESTTTPHGSTGLVEHHTPDDSTTLQTPTKSTTDHDVPESTTHHALTGFIAHHTTILPSAENESIVSTTQATSVDSTIHNSSPDPTTAYNTPGDDPTTQPTSVDSTTIHNSSPDPTTKHNTPVESATTDSVPFDSTTLHFTSVDSSTIHNTPVESPTSHSTSIDPTSHIVLNPHMNDHPLASVKGDSRDPSTTENNLNSSIPPAYNPTQMPLSVHSTNTPIPLDDYIWDDLEDSTDDAIVYEDITDDPIVFEDSTDDPIVFEDTTDDAIVFEDSTDDPMVFEDSTDDPLVFEDRTNNSIVYEDSTNIPASVADITQSVVSIDYTTPAPVSQDDITPSELPPNDATLTSALHKRHSIDSLDSPDAINDGAHASLLVHDLQASSLNSEPQISGDNDLNSNAEKIHTSVTADEGKVSLAIHRSPSPISVLDNSQTLMPVGTYTEVPDSTSQYTEEYFDERKQTKLPLYVEDHVDIALDGSVNIDDSTHFGVPLDDGINMDDGTHIGHPIDDANNIEVSIDDTNNIGIPVNDNTQVGVPLDDINNIKVPVNDRTHIEVPIDSTHIGIPLGNTHIEVSVNYKTQTDVPIDDITPTENVVEDSKPTEIPVNVVIPSKLSDDYGNGLPVGNFADHTSQPEIPVEDNTHMNIPVESSTHTEILVEDDIPTEVPVGEIAPSESVHTGVPLGEDRLTETFYQSSINTEVPVTEHINTNINIEDSIHTEVPLGETTHMDDVVQDIVNAEFPVRDNTYTNILEDSMQSEARAGRYAHSELSVTDNPNNDASFTIDDFTHIQVSDHSQQNTDSNFAHNSVGNSMHAIDSNSRIHTLYQDEAHPFNYEEGKNSQKATDETDSGSVNHLASQGTILAKKIGIILEDDDVPPQITSLPTPSSEHKDIHVFPDIIPDYRMSARNYPKLANDPNNIHHVLVESTLQEYQATGDTWNGAASSSPSFAHYPSLVIQKDERGQPLGYQASILLGNEAHIRYGDNLYPDNKGIVPISLTESQTEEEVVDHAQNTIHYALDYDEAESFPQDYMSREDLPQEGLPQGYMSRAGLPLEDLPEGEDLGKSVTARKNSLADYPMEHRGEFPAAAVQFYKDHYATEANLPASFHIYPNQPAPDLEPPAAFIYESENQPTDESDSPVPFQYHYQDHHTGSYRFGYGDAHQWRHEERRGDGVVVGRYGWHDSRGTPHVTHFVADAGGYRLVQPGQQVYLQVPDKSRTPLDGSTLSEGGPINSIKTATALPLSQPARPSFTLRPLTAQFSSSTPKVLLPALYQLSNNLPLPQVSSNNIPPFSVPKPPSNTPPPPPSIPSSAPQPSLPSSSIVQPYLSSPATSSSIPTSAFTSAQSNHPPSFGLVPPPIPYNVPQQSQSSGHRSDNVRPSVPIHHTFSDRTDRPPSVHQDHSPSIDTESSPSVTTDPSPSVTTDPSPSVTTDPSPSVTTDPSPSVTTDPSPVTGNSSDSMNDSPIIFDPPPVISMDLESSGSSTSQSPVTSPVSSPATSETPLASTVSLSVATGRPAIAYPLPQQTGTYRPGSWLPPWMRPRPGHRPNKPNYIIRKPISSPFKPVNQVRPPVTQSPRPLRPLLSLLGLQRFTTPKPNPEILNTSSSDTSDNSSQPTSEDDPSLNLTEDENELNMQDTLDKPLKKPSPPYITNSEPSQMPGKPQQDNIEEDLSNPPELSSSFKPIVDSDTPASSSHPIVDNLLSLLQGLGLYGQANSGNSGFPFFGNSPVSTMNIDRFSEDEEPSPPLPSHSLTPPKSTGNTNSQNIRPILPLPWSSSVVKIPHPTTYGRPNKPKYPLNYALMDDNYNVLGTILDEANNINNKKPVLSADSKPDMYNADKDITDDLNKNEITKEPHEGTTKAPHPNSYTGSVQMLIPVIGELESVSDYHGLDTTKRYQNSSTPKGFQTTVIPDNDDDTKTPSSVTGITQTDLEIQVTTERIKVTTFAVSASSSSTSAVWPYIPQNASSTSGPLATPSPPPPPANFWGNILQHLYNAQQKVVPQQNRRPILQ